MRILIAEDDSRLLTQLDSLLQQQCRFGRQWRARALSTQ